MTKKDFTFWNFDHIHSWTKKKGPSPASFENISEFTEALGYSPYPELVIGDEFNFIAICQHLNQEKYLFHFEMDGFRKFLFTNNLPSMLLLFKQLNSILNENFKTTQLLADLIHES